MGRREGKAPTPRGCWWALQGPIRDRACPEDRYGILPEALAWSVPAP